jgi:hypothetical protein
MPVTIITKSDLIAEAAKDYGFRVQRPGQVMERDLRFCDWPCVGRIMRSCTTGERYCGTCRKPHPPLALSYRPPSY